MDNKLFLCGIFIDLKKAFDNTQMLKEIALHTSRIYPYSPTEGIGISWEVGGSARPKNLRNVWSLIGISRGVGDLRKNPFHGGVMDIFWNYTLSSSEYCRLHPPVNAWAQNMYSRDVKCLSFRWKTLKFSRPLLNGMEPRDNCLAIQSCSSFSSGVFPDKQKLPFLLIRNIFPLSSVEK